MQKLIEIRTLRPNNWFLNEEKIQRLMTSPPSQSVFPSTPLTVAQFGGSYSLIDGHTRAWVADQRGITLVKCEIISLTPGSPEAKLYLWLHHEAEEKGLLSIRDLPRLSATEYKRQWLEFCRMKLAEFGGLRSGLEAQ